MQKTSETAAALSTGLIDQLKQHPQDHTFTSGERLLNGIRNVAWVIGMVNKLLNASDSNNTSNNTATIFDDGSNDDEDQVSTLSSEFIAQGMIVMAFGVFLVPAFLTHLYISWYNDEMVHEYSVEDYQQ